MNSNSRFSGKDNQIFIGEKLFLDDDQFIFARISADHNPMHMDDLAARRLLAGKKVVHGIHLLLWALEYELTNNTVVLQGIKCDFKKPVHVGDKAIFLCDRSGENKSVIRVYADELLCLKITLIYGSGDLSLKNNMFEHAVYSEYSLLENVTEPLDLLPHDQVGKKYKIPLFHDADIQLFQVCRARLGGDTFSSLCSLSFFVGMICPGLHSLFSTLNINIVSLMNTNNHLFYSVKSFESRFELFYISVSGNISGEITAFQRPPPTRQVNVIDLVNHVKSNEFVNNRSLIIGGSRGLGEYTAKLLVAGGAEVILTYSQGLSDAQRVCDELNTFRHGSCKIQQYDVEQNISGVFTLEEVQSLAAVYFFATPKIFRKKADGFNKNIYDEFYLFYVSCFDQLCAYLERVRRKPIIVFLPSSVAVVETPSELAEYAKAKLSAEALAEKINGSYKNVSIMVSRLPRLETDQTATIAKVAAASTLETMLPLVRRIYQE